MRQAAVLELVAVVGLVCLAGYARAGAAPSAETPAKAPPCTIVSPAGASFAESLAAKEVRRYVYLRTGQLLPIIEKATKAPDAGDVILVAAKANLKDEPFRAAAGGLEAEQYLLKTFRPGNGKVLLITGGDPVGTLYGAYRFAERLGVRFYMHGDVIPDEKIPLALPDLDERAKPLFSIRGIQPFHDFPEGPDWWNADDYKAVISQLAKMRMNFIGLHTYPEGGVGPEPTVWIGLAQDIGPNQEVKFSSVSSWMNTLRGNWGYAPKKTGEYNLGAAELFDRDDFGPDVMAGFCPKPRTPEECNELFARSGALLREAFAHARQLGVKTCVGTETPLTIPKVVQEHLKSLGKDPKDKAVVQEVYEGLFRRIAQAYPLDYYWFWTPEGWTWGANKPEDLQRTLDDFHAAIAAARKVNAPFTLATCGWVLGPANDRALFDNVLPKVMPMSCINRQVGKSPVEPGFAKVAGRPKWAIPWMEDDPNLLMPQLWAGRMRKDAADALKYGCTGLLGIHWRTRILGPNVSALAQAAWNQPWKTAVAPEPAARPKEEGPEGGKAAAFPKNKITGTDTPALYQTVRYDMAAYRFKAPNGAYTVTLKFCEPHYSANGVRVFGVELQGKKVIEGLDIHRKAGPNKALDFTFKDVQVSDGWLDIEFVPEVEFPCIAAIAIEGKDFARKVNCGGPKHKDYDADWTTAGDAPDKTRGRFAPVADFYLDWARAEFGPEVAEPAAAIFTKIDGYLPQTSTWIKGPGGLKAETQPFGEIRKRYAFVDEFAALRPRVKGAGQRERFDYWLNNFRTMLAAEKLKCAWGRKDAAAMKEAYAEVYRCLLATVTTPGELGTVMNWEQHNLPEMKVQLDKTYTGAPRVIVPTVRTSLAAGEVLRLKVLILAAKPVKEAALYLRPMGGGEFAKAPLVHVARGVYTVKAAPKEDFEYYVEAAPADGDAVRWPATAPAMGQTVVVTP